LSIRALSLPFLQLVPYSSAEVSYRLLPGCSLLLSPVIQYRHFQYKLYISEGPAAGRIRFLPFPVLIVAHHTGAA
jgi:hypothetical protein